MNSFTVETWMAEKPGDSMFNKIEKNEKKITSIYWIFSRNQELSFNTCNNFKSNKL